MKMFLVLMFLSAAAGTSFAADAENPAPNDVVISVNPEIPQVKMLDKPNGRDVLYAPWFGAEYTYTNNTDRVVSIGYLEFLITISSTDRQVAGKGFNPPMVLQPKESKRLTIYLAGLHQRYSQEYPYWIDANAFGWAGAQEPDTLDLLGTFEFKAQ